MIKVLSIK